MMRLPVASRRLYGSVSISRCASLACCEHDTACRMIGRGTFRKWRDPSEPVAGADATSIPAGEAWTPCDTTGRTSRYGISDIPGPRNVRASDSNVHRGIAASLRCGRTSRSPVCDIRYRIVWPISCGCLSSWARGKRVLLLCDRRCRSPLTDGTPCRSPDVSPDLSCAQLATARCVARLGGTRCKTIVHDIPHSIPVSPSQCQSDSLSTVSDENQDGGSGDRSGRTGACDTRSTARGLCALRIYVE